MHGAQQLCWLRHMIIGEYYSWSNAPRHKTHYIYTLFWIIFWIYAFMRLLSINYIFKRQILWSKLLKLLIITEHNLFSWWLYLSICHSYIHTKANIIQIYLMKIYWIQTNIKLLDWKFYYIINIFYHWLLNELKFHLFLSTTLQKQPLLFLSSFWQQLQAQLYYYPITNRCQIPEWLKSKWILFFWVNDKFALKSVFIASAAKLSFFSFTWVS